MKLLILSVLVVAACGFPRPQSYPILPLADIDNLRNTFRNFLNGTLAQINTTNFLSFGFDRINETTSRFSKMLNRTVLNTMADPLAELTCLTTDQRTAVKKCQDFSVNKCPSMCALKEAGAIDASGKVIQASLASIITATNLLDDQKMASITALQRCLMMSESGTVSAMQTTMQSLFTNLTGIPLNESCISAGVASSCVLQALVTNGCVKAPRFSAMVQMPSESENSQKLDEESSSEEDDEDDEEEEAEKAQLRAQRMAEEVPESSPETDEEDEIAEAQKQVGSLALYQVTGNDEDETSSEEEEAPGRVERDLRVAGGQSKGTSGRSANHRNGNRGGSGRRRGHNNKHGRNCTTTTTSPPTVNVTEVVTEPDAENTDP